MDISDEKKFKKVLLAMLDDDAVVEAIFTALDKKIKSQQKQSKNSENTFSRFNPWSRDESAALRQQKEEAERSCATLRQQLASAQSRAVAAEQRERELETLATEQKEQIATLEKAKRDLAQEKATLLTAKQNLTEELSSAQQIKQALQQERDTYRKNFAEVIAAYACYQELSLSIRDRLQSKIKTDNYLLFLATCAQLSTAKGIWEEMSYKQNLTASDREGLITIMDFSLKLVNARYTTPVYELMLSEVGRPYDDSRHIRSNNCNTYQGKIKKVLVPGIWNFSKDMAEKKCIVEY